MKNKTNRNPGKTFLAFTAPSLSPQGVRPLLFLQGVLCLFVFVLQPVLAQHDPARDAVKRLVRGDLNGTVNQLKNDPSRPLAPNEERFVRAMVACERGNPEKAWYHAKQALEAGMPITRFQAGPRDILQPLYQYEPYQQYVTVHGKKLLQGPMLGSLTDRSVRVWVRTAESVNVHVRAHAAYATRDERKTHTSNSVRTRPDTDYTVVVQLDGLEPDTTYSYQVFIDDNPVGERHLFDTWPEEGKPGTFRIGMGACSGYTPKYERMWNRIERYDLNGFLTLGDNVYIDDPKHTATQRYCYYRRQSRPEFRRFAATTALAAIYDDHDFGKNDTVPGGDADHPAWKRDAWNVFKQNWVNPSYGGGPEQPGCWFDFKIADVHFILLDTRYYRSNKKRDMLGPAQEKWLLNTLESSDAAFKLVASSVPFAPGVKGGSDDTWDGFPGQRDRIFSFIREHEIGGVMLLAGDRHRTNIRRIPREDGSYFHELVSARLTNVHTHGLMKNAKGSEFVVGYNDKPSFLILHVDTTKDPAELTARCININGKEIFQRIFTSDKLYSKLPSNRQAIDVVSQGEIVSSRWFNRTNFVMDVSFTTPQKWNSDKLNLVAEVGGSERGTVIGLRQGRLVITAGRKNSDHFTWKSGEPLEPDTRYNVRVHAVSQNSGPNDFFTAHLLRQGEKKPRKILHKKEMDVDGFAGSNEGGAGIVGGSLFNPENLPVKEAPDAMQISLQESDTAFSDEILNP